MKKKNPIWLILFVLFLLLIVLGVASLIIQAGKEKKANNSYSDLQTEVNKVVEENLPDTETQTETEVNDALSGIEIPEKNLDWNALREENADIYAWIYVPNTTVDYPILQHPTDNTYYLNYNMDGTKGYPGCIYTEDYNTKDFSDTNTVIYGHNLKDKTMFSSLHNFEDDEVFNQDNYIFIYTEDYVFVYRVFAAYEYEGIHLIANFDYSNEYVYKDYIDSIFEGTGRVSKVKEDVEVTTDDKIVTLSTCTTDHNSNYRFLVAGVLLNPRQ